VHLTTQVLALNPLSASSVITSLGTLGVIAIIFCETGIFFGLILPGDSLLFTAGVFCVKNVPGTSHKLNLAAVLVGTAIAAVLGGQTGYWVGRKGGAPLFERPESRIFKQKYVTRSAEFFTKYGLPKGIVLARFVPIVRTLINPFAGIIKADARVFMLWNAVGGVLWTVLVTLLGYALGSSIKGSIDHYILPVVAVILVISVIPLAIELVKARRESRATKAAAQG
jgi:membrane-associated protein